MANVKEREVLISDERADNKTYRTIVDRETGEVLSQRWIIEQDKKPGRPQGGKKAHFYKIYVTNWDDIVRKKKLDFTEIGFLCSLLSFLGWQTAYLVHPDTEENLTESKIAELLKCNRGHLHTLIERLVKKGLVAKVVNGSGKGNHFMINTNIFFFGSTIDDIRMHNTFGAACEHKPPVSIKYKQTEKK